MALALSLPVLAQAKSLKEIVNGTIVPLGDLVITLLYSLAFVFFLVGIARFFFADGDKERTKAKEFAFWSIIAFFVLFGVWGLVNVLLGLLIDFT
jgi:hypothetical protein